MNLDKFLFATDDIHLTSLKENLTFRKQIIGIERKRIRSHCYLVSTKVSLLLSSPMKEISSFPQVVPWPLVLAIEMRYWFAGRTNGDARSRTAEKQTAIVQQRIRKPSALLRMRRAELFSSK
ncbi:hypothetical protein AVEN_247416-1 [Araneus ventricosus]|uniref:Uncharacterized protein n=1 Tax=Araneus ventricosus TaxID=182803 RepID=A0A4Y2PLN3_ARAVE|nr:hypothetical protein AVEN_247416-1 [Araneus ventricosus]